MASTNTPQIATKPKTDENKQIGDSLNSPVIANVFKAEVSKITETSPKDRAKALLAAVNVALAKAGQPPIEKVEIQHLSDSATTGEQANYDASKSTMTINDTALKAKTLTSDVAATVYHEAVHHQQSYNVARYLASAKPNGRSMTSEKIQAIGISKGIVDKAVESVAAHKTKSPLSDKQLRTAKSIYRSLYDPTNTFKYKNVVYQYSDGVYTALRDNAAKIDAINKALEKNPNAFTAKQIAQANSEMQKIYKLYIALPNEKEAFDAEKLVQSTKGGALKSSSQNTSQSAPQITSVSSIDSKNSSNTQISSIENDSASTSSENSDSVTDNSAQNTSNDSSSNSTDVSKVITLLKENANTVKQQYGLDVTTDDGLGKAVMQYWKENNLDPKILKEQLPSLKNSKTASSVESQDGTNSNSEVSKVVTLLKENANTVKQQYGLDVTTNEGLGKAVMQYWKENNLDPKILKEQLPSLKESEFNKASTALTNTKTTEKETTKTKQLVFN